MRSHSEKAKPLSPNLLWEEIYFVIRAILFRAGS